MNPTLTIILLSHKWAIDTTHKSGSSLLSRSGRASKREQEQEQEQEQERERERERARARARERERVTESVENWSDNGKSLVSPRTHPSAHVCQDHIYICIQFFSDAPSHLLQQVYPSVHPSVRPSTRPSVPLSFLPSVSSWVEYAFVNNL